MRLLNFLLACYRAYVTAGPGGVGYCSVSSFGVPVASVLVARDRSAWVVTNFAFNVYGAVEKSRQHAEAQRVH